MSSSTGALAWNGKDYTHIRKSTETDYVPSHQETGSECSWMKKSNFSCDESNLAIYMKINGFSCKFMKSSTSESVKFVSEILVKAKPQRQTSEG